MFFTFSSLSEWRRSLQSLHNSPPPGFAYRIIFMECCDVDPKSVSRFVMDYDFKGEISPWDIDRVGTQFALLGHIENLPNNNNVVHLVLMVIYPKNRAKSLSSVVVGSAAATAKDETNGSPRQSEDFSETLNPMPDDATSNSEDESVADEK